MMRKHSVTKIIEFCYGHRLINYDGPCKNLHGHNGVLEIDIESNTLDQRGMVIDFTEVKNRVKSWIDHHLDHKMLLSSEDPLVPMLKTIGEPYYLIEGNPTAENIATHIFEAVTSDGLDIARVKLWETNSSYASYSRK